VSTSGTDGDLHVKLTDVYPDGRSMLITEASQALRFRDGCEAPVAVTPDEIMPVEVDLWSTCIIINAGHSLRVVIGASNFPRYVLNSGWAEGDPDGGPTSMTIYTGGAHVAELRVSVPDVSEHQPPVEIPVVEPAAEPVVEDVAELAPDVSEDTSAQDLPVDTGSVAEAASGSGSDDGGCNVASGARRGLGIVSVVLLGLLALVSLRARRSRSLARR
jgi:hypothetical protein